ncbi:unnamed protein product [Thlaspi arvense]|uniref:DNA replication ATP-dependent helicase/nuclease n=1 Tax=Thlaspi arvense TaxID=13288 RepID=A0AAU9RHH9_THLAR|nr:unnamed protein product [Thlaspi arvense]
MMPGTGKTSTMVHHPCYMLRASEASDQNAINNPVEASIIAEIVEELVNNGVDSKDIGIITPYNSQTSLIQHAISTTPVEIHTIDKCQLWLKDSYRSSFLMHFDLARVCSLIANVLMSSHGLGKR